MALRFCTHGDQNLFSTSENKTCSLLDNRACISLYSIWQVRLLPLTQSVLGEPGNMILLRFGLYLFKRRVTAQEVGSAWQRQLGAGAGEEFWVLLKIIEQDQELA